MPEREGGRWLPLDEFVAGPENLLLAQSLRPLLEPNGASSDALLLLYGPQGCGKSHLVHGLADWWQRHFPDSEAIILSGADFARELGQALQLGARLEAWRRRLRDANLFVLDDLSQVASKRPAQHELVLVLDELHEQGIPVVITARSLPTHWSSLGPALRGRLSAGLCVPVRPPAAATRRVILDHLAALKGVSLPTRVVQRLADSLTASVPAIAAAVLELGLQARVNGQPAQQQSLDEGLDVAPEKPTLREIARVTAKYYGLTVAQLQSPKRSQALVTARAMAMFLARELAGCTLQQIGTFFGRRDHTTVLHGWRRTARLLDRDRATRLAMAQLRQLLTP